MPDRPLCRHCHKCKISRPRELCWSCWHKLEIRVLYPVTSKFAPKHTKELPAAEAHDATTAELDAMIAEQRKVLPSWWQEDKGNVGFDPKDRLRQPKKRLQADAPRMPKPCRRAGKK